MAAKLICTTTVYKVEVSTKVTFVDEYDSDYTVVPTTAEVYSVDGKLDKIEFTGDDESGMYMMAMIRDLTYLSAPHRRVVDQILAACDLKA